MGPSSFWRLLYLYCNSEIQAICQTACATEILSYFEAARSLFEYSCLDLLNFYHRLYCQIFLIKLDCYSIF